MGVRFEPKANPSIDYRGPVERPVCGSAMPAASVAATGSVHISYYVIVMEIHPAARRHGVADEDIRHAATNAIAVDDQDDDTKLYLGPARDAAMLEIVTIVRDDGTELVIHAMKMRPKYRPLLPRTEP
jgi:hypothetical protein